MEKSWIDEAVEQYLSDDGDCDYDFDSISDLLESTENITVEDLRKLLVWEDSRVLACIVKHPACTLELVEELNQKWVEYGFELHEEILFSPLCTPEIRDYILGTSGEYWSHLSNDEKNRRISVMEKIKDEDLNAKLALGWIAQKRGNRAEALSIWEKEEPAGDVAISGLWKYGERKPKTVSTPSDQDCYELSRNPAVNPWLLYQFSFINDDYTEQAVTCNPTTPLLILEYYAASVVDHNLDSLVFSNPALPSHLYKFGTYKNLSESRIELVHALIATNLGIPDELIEELSHHESKEVLFGLASNPVFAGNKVLSAERTAEILGLYNPLD
jgi:hypothetical protein